MKTLNQFTRLQKAITIAMVLTVIVMAILFPEQLKY